jgi:hypothetical protein
MSKKNYILVDMCAPRRNSCKTAPLLRPNLMQISLHKRVDAHTGLASGTSMLSINLYSISNKIYGTFFGVVSKRRHISDLYPSNVHIGVLSDVY